MTTCSDLIFQHYLHSEKNHISHADTPSYAHFEWPEKEWLILHPSHPPPTTLPLTGAKSYVINTYHHPDNLPPLPTPPTITAPLLELSTSWPLPPPSANTLGLTTSISRALPAERGKQVNLHLRTDATARLGYLLLRRDVETKRIYVGDVWIAEEWRRKGLAMWLLATVFSGPEYEGWTLWLTVFEANMGARKLYAKVGFEERNRLWMVTGPAC